ncbi:MAG: DUF5683 domain-containing protein [Cyclobacteriaceae bacterium]|nr:MAG: DUF5683 domain-containing protein [Cyclobacteriaceae bacterium]
MKKPEAISKIVRSSLRGIPIIPIAIGIGRPKQSRFSLKIGDCFTAFAMTEPFLKRLSILFCLVGFTLGAYAQRDSIQVVQPKSDTVTIASYSNRYDPRKALLYAAVLPGLGQVYNKKYWKLPLVYGGFAITGYYLNIYQEGYLTFRGELFYNLENGLSGDTQVNPNTLYTTSQLRTIVDRYRRERDYMIIIMMGVYILQMVDAHVDSHLKEFDLNPNLQVRIEPAFSNELLTGRMGGISLKIRF